MMTALGQNTKRSCQWEKVTWRPCYDSWVALCPNINAQTLYKLLIVLSDLSF